jgi:hypothetical protein
MNIPVQCMAGRPFALSAGMGRSGSTLLFNMARLILEEKWGKELVSGWQDDIPGWRFGKYYLVKTHRLSLWRRAKPEYIFFSYRDVRTAMVSGRKFWGIPYSLETAKTYIKEWKIAKRRANLIISYEDLVSWPNRVVQKIAKILGIDTDSDTIAEKALAPGHFVADSNMAYDKISLYYQNHCTHTMDNEWRSAIPAEFQKEINKQFAWWFKECGYPKE